MSKQLLEISDFKKCIVNDETSQSNKGFVDMLGLDPWTEDGILQINKRLIEDTTTSLTDNVLSFSTFDSKTIAGVGGKELWYENTTDTWTLLHTNSNAGDNNDLIVYQKYLIYSSNTKLGRSTTTAIAGGFTDSPTWGSGTVFSNGTSSDEHYFKIFNNRLYISDGNYLAELDGASDPTTPANWIFTPEKFVLPEGEIILSLEVSGGYLAMGTSAGNFYTWDGSSSNASQIIKTQLGGMTALIQLENTLYAFAGINGTVYRYNGADFVPAIQVPNVNISSQSMVRKPAVRRYKNGLIFGLSRNGIYVWNRIKEGESFSLNKYGNFSGGQIIDSDDGNIYSIYIIDQSSSDDRFVIGYFHTSANRIDKPSSSTRYRMYEAGSGDTTGAPLIETFVYELRDKNGKSNKVQGIQGLFKQTVETGTDRNNIQVEYRYNRNTTYTVLGNIGSDGINLDKILRGIGKRVDNIQFRIKFGEQSTSDTGIRNTKLTLLKIF